MNSDRFDIFSKNDDLLAEQGQNKATERLIILVVLAVIAVLTVVDLVEDRIEGATWAHLVVEGSMMLACVIGITAIWRATLKEYKRKSRELNLRIVAARKDAQHWRNEAGSLLQGLGLAIDQQLSAWSLTEAEKEVALMLLKGLSHKEIAEVRNTVEKTVRQQAASVYQKSALEGRAQLSAFFLEDILLPMKK